MLRACEECGHGFEARVDEVLCGFTRCRRVRARAIEDFREGLFAVGNRMCPKCAAAMSEFGVVSQFLRDSCVCGWKAHKSRRYYLAA